MSQCVIKVLVLQSEGVFFLQLAKFQEFTLTNKLQNNVVVIKMTTNVLYLKVHYHIDIVGLNFIESENA